MQWRKGTDTLNPIDPFFFLAHQKISCAIQGFPKRVQNSVIRTLLAPFGHVNYKHVVTEEVNCSIRVNMFLGLTHQVPTTSKSESHFFCENSLFEAILYCLSPPQSLFTTQSGLKLNLDKSIIFMTFLNTPSGKKNYPCRAVAVT